MPAAEPQFSRLTGTSLYWMDGAGQTIGFQPSPAGSGLGDTPTLTQTWTDPGGLYFFLGSAPTASATFAAALLPYLQQQGWPNGPRFLWLDNPSATSTQWSGQTLSLNGGTGNWHVSNRADFKFKDYILSVLGGGTVALATAAQGWGFAFSAANSLPVANFTAPGGAYPAQGGTLLLPLTGAISGCWSFSISLTNGGATPNDFAQLDLGLRYFYPDASGSGSVLALQLPTLLQPATGTLTLYAALDSLRPLVPARSYLSFIPPGGGAGPAALTSTFGTARGYGVSLAPLASPSAAVPDAGLVFAVQPLFTGSDNNVPFRYYLTLQGAFTLGWLGLNGGSAQPAGDDDNSYRLLCGAAGIEYMAVPASVATQLVFVPGQAAYSSLEATADSTAFPLEPLGTTAWVYPAAATTGTITYYAQPEQAPLYQAPLTQTRTATVGSVFMDFLPVPVLDLPASTGALCLPMAPYRGLGPADVAAAQALEGQAIAPARRQVLRQLDPGEWQVSPTSPIFLNPPATATVGVTPQGIAVGLAAGLETWTWAGLANSTAGASAPDLRFTAVGGALQQALQTNRLFLVLGNADKFAANGSVAYQLTAEGCAEISADGSVPPAVLTAVQTAFSAAGYPVYQTEALFNQALVAASSGITPDQQLVFQRHSGLLTPVIADWLFQLSPRNWWNPERTERNSAIMVFKFNRGRSLREMADDLSAWVWSEAAAFPGLTAEDTRTELKSIFAASADAFARTSGGGRHSPYAPFMRLLDDPNWCGIITFSCDVPLSTLPEPLQALAVGIDTKRFYAHHVGFNITPFGADPGQLVFGATSMFGLIDYQDPDDQVVQPAPADPALQSQLYYAFKVLQLTVGFENSAISDFSSRVELMVNRLFGATTRLYPSDHGNNVILDGVYQKQPLPDGTTAGTYVFTMERQNTLQLENSALRRVVLLSTQMITARPADPQHPAVPVQIVFQMGGDMHFYEAPEFDAFSFGADDSGQAGAPPSQLRFGNLGIRMSFTLAARQPTFALVTETLSFDLPNSVARPDSLFNRFPLRLASFLATPDPLLLPANSATPAPQTPDKLGYVSIDALVQQSLMTAPWYGLVFNIDLGTLGALAGSVGLTLRLLVAWSGGGTREQPAVYIGVQMPGMKDALGVELPLQGVLSLGFRTIQFLVYTDARGRGYTMRFRNFALRFLGLSFPPGHNDIYLFGNPNQSSGTKLGWYAAYSADKDDKKQKSTGPASRRLLARRDLPPQPALAPRVAPPAPTAPVLRLAAELPAPVSAPPAASSLSDSAPAAPAPSPPPPRPRRSKSAAAKARPKRKKPKAKRAATPRRKKSAPKPPAKKKRRTTRRRKKS